MLIRIVPHPNPVHRNVFRLFAVAPGGIRKFCGDVRVQRVWKACAALQRMDAAK